MVDLEKLADDEYIQFIRDNHFDPARAGKYSLEVRLSVVRQLMSIFELVENRQQLVYIIDNSPRVITEACAGAGKTSISLLKVMTHLMFGDYKPGRVILMSYTRESRLDMEQKYDILFTKLKGIDMGPLELSMNIKFTTMHAYFDEILYEYAEFLGIQVKDRRMYIFDETERIGMIKDTVTTLLSKKIIDVKIYDSLYRRLLSLYTQIKEKNILDTPDTWCRCSEFKTVGEISVPDLIQIYKVYEKIKRAKQGVELGEYANMSLKALANRSFRKRWQERYDFYLVDEYQDITQVQVDFLKLLLDPQENPNACLAAIGDGDQAIYGFRGAHSNGCYNFDKDFGINGQPVSRCFMSLNRRCPELVLESARKVIETLSVRNYKRLDAMRTGGVVEIYRTRNAYEEVNSVIKILQERIPKNEYDDTVIAYRNNRSARLMKRSLEDIGIKVKSNKGIVDIFETSLTSCLAMLDDPFNIQLALRNLYKVTPKSARFASKELREVLEAENASRKAGNPMKAFYELDFSNPNAPEDLPLIIKRLGFLSFAMHGEIDESKYEKFLYMDVIVRNLVFGFLFKYYLQWQDMKTDNDGAGHILSQDGTEIVDPYSKKIYNFYTQHVTWKQLKRDISKRDMVLQNSFSSVNLYTFHSLKGLEFKHVFLIDLTDHIFPGYEIQQAAEFGPQYISQADDEAKRLFYVAMTRSKSQLFMFFDDINPSRYLSILESDNAVVDDTTNEFDFSAMEDEPLFEVETPVEIEENRDIDISSDSYDPVEQSVFSRWLNG